MIDTARTTLKDPAALILGAIAAQVIGGLVPQVSPLMISGLMQGLALSERDAGLVISVELLALAATAIAIVPLLQRVTYRRICLAAAALAVVAQGASIFGTSLAEVTVLRALSGVGAGALYAVSLSVVAARSANPDKVYSYFQIVWALGSIALFTVGGQLTGAFAQRGIFALMLGLTLTLAPMLLLLPRLRESVTVADAVQALPENRSSPVLGVMTLLVIGLCLVGSGAIYAFVGPLGERAGLDTSAVGYVLTAATLCGLAGAGAATALNVKWGRMIPLSGVFAGYTLVVAVLCFSQNATAYVVTVVGFVVIYYFSMPYLFGLAAALDRTGRWAAAGGSAFLLGCAAGPLFAGTMIEGAGYAGLAVACVAILLVAWCFAAIVCQRLSRGAGGLGLNASSDRPSSWRDRPTSA
jgi:predicted MFS family arabinose efflux permease